MRRVVITGVGTVNSLGNNSKEYWNNVVGEKLGFSYVDKFDSETLGVHIVSQVKDFVPDETIEKKELRRMDRFTQFAVTAANEALRDSSTKFEDLDPFRVGVIIGCGIGGLELTQTEHAKYLEKGPNRISVFYIPMMIANMAAGTVAMRTGFKGDNFATVTACSSSTHAIGESFRKIKDGYLDACICGGTESCITEFAMGGFNNMKALSRSDRLDRASIPFDKERNGFVLGEGCGILVLEEYEHAKARGAQIYAEIAGYGATCDAYHMTSPSPEGDAAARAMVNAYTEAGLKAEDVDYINAHGTSTGLNDKYETTAIKKALGDHASKVKINSTKSMIGHLLGAAGAVEAIITALQIKNSYIHRTLGYQVFDEECDLDYCTQASIKMPVRTALSNSLGFGGHNATICMKAIDE
ncbi:MAG: beta-ketoacyl-ACP synthase II [Oscillospiraceae bacterium]|nr:beta-ketoacyl-ACP synthase II [Oscillospiraceae bacterium]